MEFVEGFILTTSVATLLLSMVLVAFEEAWRSKGFVGLTWFISFITTTSHAILFVVYMPYIGNLDWSPTLFGHAMSILIFGIITVLLVAAVIAKKIAQ